MTAYPQVGALAPDLDLPDQHGDRQRLADLVAERHLLMVFFPFAFSSICTGELLEIQLNIDEFVNDRVQVVGVSCDPTSSLRAWSAHEGYRFPLLSDFWPHGRVSRAYGVLDEDTGAAARGTFLVDPRGVVTWSLVHGPGEERPIGLLHEAVRGL
ncbi:peroxiredoxin [Ornithinimicrobium sp. W1679]|uniref:peroxiredoxin n=1 Tax=Ornithinimicrobium sp. W1679 TaxID=3418770 RepID=UPI003CF7054B